MSRFLFNDGRDKRINGFNSGNRENSYAGKFMMGVDEIRLLGSYDMCLPAIYASEFIWFCATCSVSVSNI